MRISCTVLESFRLFMDPENEWFQEQELIDTICGKFVPNHAVKRGHAFGQVLETPDPYRVTGGYVCEHFFFGDDVMQPALALINRSATVFEAKAIGRFGPHEVVSKADQLCGADLIETKTTEHFDFDKYANSCQWRFMVDAFQPARVTYHVFVLAEPERGPSEIQLRSVETFHLYPYAALRQDCERLVREFDAYVTAKGLTGILDARQAELAGAF